MSNKDRADLQGMTMTNSNPYVYLAHTLISTSVGPTAGIGTESDTTRLDGSPSMSWMQPFIAIAMLYVTSEALLWIVI